LDCVLHIGMHKTGTTAIQGCLSGYDDGTTRYADLGPSNHSVPLATIFADNPELVPSHRMSGRSQSEVCKLQEKWSLALERDLRGPSRRLILSAESLTTNMMSLKAVIRLRDRIASAGRSVQVITYVRDPVSLANSKFQQRLRGGETRLHVPRPNYRARFKKIIDAFGRDRTEFIRYDRVLFPDRSVVRDFATRFSIMPEKPLLGDTNPSMCQDAAALLLEFNRHGPRASGTPALARARQRFLRVLRFDLVGPPFRLPDAWLNCAIHMPDLQWLSQNTGVSFKIEDEYLRPTRPPEPKTDLPPAGEATRTRITEILRGLGVDASADEPSLDLTTKLFFHFLSQLEHRSA